MAQPPSQTKGERGRPHSSAARPPRTGEESADAERQREQNQRDREAADVRDARKQAAETREARRRAADELTAYRASMRATLTRIGFDWRHCDADAGAVVDVLSALVPRDSKVLVCASYVDVKSRGAHQLREQEYRIMRPLPPAQAEILPSVRLVLCTKHRLLWTSSRFVAQDDAVVEESVTAHSIDFGAILGAVVRRKGAVHVWMHDGPSLTFRTTVDEAAQLASYIDRASAAASV